jgi:hypothetical protein
MSLYEEYLLALSPTRVAQRQLKTFSGTSSAPGRQAATGTEMPQLSGTRRPTDDPKTRSRRSNCRSSALRKVNSRPSRLGWSALGRYANLVIMQSFRGSARRSLKRRGHRDCGPLHNLGVPGKANQPEQAGQ